MTKVDSNRPIFSTENMKTNHVGSKLTKIIKLVAKIALYTFAALAAVLAMVVVMPLLILALPIIGLIILATSRGDTKKTNQAYHQTYPAPYESNPSEPVYYSPPSPYKTPTRFGPRPTLTPAYVSPYSYHPMNGPRPPLGDHPELAKPLFPSDDPMEGPRPPLGKGYTTPPPKKLFVHK